jgi:hypothetical protein
MARGNQKNGDTAIRFRTIVWTFGACAVVAMLGLGLAHQHNLHHDLAGEGRRLDREVSILEDRIRQAIKVEAALKSPLALEQRVRDLNLGLVPIQASQRLYLAHSADPRPAPALPLPRVAQATEIASAPAAPTQPNPGTRPKENPTVGARVAAAAPPPNLVATTHR